MRLTSDLWVSAYIRRLQTEGVPAYVMRRGDATAGAVLVKINTLDGQARVYQRAYDPDKNDTAWVVLIAGAEHDTDASIARQIKFDSDIWVIEVETRSGLHLPD